MLVLVSVPLLVTPFPPSADLPQHLSQIPLLEEALENPEGPYAVQWAAPNILIYLIIYAFWQVVPAEIVGRAVLALILGLWVLAIHLLAAKLKRPPEAAVLASILVFNQVFYWGFLNFLVGFPVFVIWFVLTSKDPAKDRPRNLGLMALAGYLLYASHALWFAAGALWLVVAGVVKKASPGRFLIRAATLLPCAALALLWYPRLAGLRASSGFDVAAHWPRSFFDRFSLTWFRDGVFGGLHGAAETVVFLLIYAWLGFSLWQNRGRLRTAVDGSLAAAGLLFVAIAVLGPEKYMNSIFFSSRWLPCGTAFLLLALPLPFAGKKATKCVAAATAVGFCLVTAAIWDRYEKTELTGLKESLDRVTPETRVLGLDLEKESEHIKGRPFIQLFAYAQAYRGAELNFSFAEHGSGLVSFRRRRKIPWTRSLEWYAELIRPSDYRHFDYVLVNGAEDIQGYFLKIPELKPLTCSGRWRIYSVEEH